MRSLWFLTGSIRESQLGVGNHIFVDILSRVGLNIFSGDADIMGVHCLAYNMHGPKRPYIWRPVSGRGHDRGTDEEWEKRRRFKKLNMMSERSTFVQKPLNMQSMRWGISQVYLLSSNQLSTWLVPPIILEGFTMRFSYPHQSVVCAESGKQIFLSTFLNRAWVQ